LRVNVIHKVGIERKKENCKTLC